MDKRERKIKFSNLLKNIYTSKLFLFGDAYLYFKELYFQFFNRLALIFYYDFPSTHHTHTQFPPPPPFTPHLPALLEIK